MYFPSHSHYHLWVSALFSSTFSNILIPPKAFSLPQKESWCWYFFQNLKNCGKEVQISKMYHVTILKDSSSMGSKFILLCKFDADFWCLGGITFPWQSILCSLCQFSEFFLENNLSQKETKEQIRYIIQRHRKTPIDFYYVSSAQIKYEEGKHWIYLHMIVSQNFYQPGISSIHTLFNIFTTWYF